MCEDVPRYYPLASVMKSHIEQLMPVYQASVMSEDSDRCVCVPVCGVGGWGGGGCLSTRPQ